MPSREDQKKQHYVKAVKPHPPLHAHIQFKTVVITEFVSLSEVDVLY
jgi:hypothetical protein